VGSYKVPRVVEVHEGLPREDSGRTSCASRTGAAGSVGSDGCRLDRPRSSRLRRRDANPEPS
jgi:hypothetical protein